MVLNSLGLPCFYPIPSPLSLWMWTVEPITPGLSQNKGIAVWHAPGRWINDCNTGKCSNSLAMKAGLQIRFTQLHQWGSSHIEVFNCLKTYMHSMTSIWTLCVLIKHRMDISCGRVKAPCLIVHTCTCKMANDFIKSPQMYKMINRVICKLHPEELWIKLFPLYTPLDVTSC